MNTDGLEEVGATRRRWRKGEVVLGVAAVVVLIVAGRALAAGIPSANVLSYSGRLENADHTPLVGERQVALRFWGSALPSGAPACETPPTRVTLADGEFAIPLPDPCIDAVRSTPDLWVEVQLEGASLGSTKVGAVPFAIEAERATFASQAAGALAVVIDELGSKIAGLEALVRAPTVHMYSGKLATPLEWEADLIFNGNYGRFCEAMGKTFVSAQELVSHYTDNDGNGYFYEGWYYAGARVCEADTFAYGNGDPVNPYNVWRYSETCGCCALSVNWSFERRALITCQ